MSETNRIREIIDSRGLRYDWVAENVLRISKQNFCHKLNGRGRFTARQRERLAAFLGVEVGELFPDAPVGEVS
jgi:hypothetical protein